LNADLSESKDRETGKGKKMAKIYNQNIPSSLNFNGKTYDFSALSHLPQI
jgi:hypothetical protein